MISICICGTYCAGKSTLSKRLAEVLPNTELVVDAAREMVSTLDTVDWAHPTVREYLLMEQVLRERRASKLSKQYVVVDGGIIGNLAHDMLFKHARRVPINNVRPFGNSSYDLIVYCEYKEVFLVDDGQRLTDEKLREELACCVEQCVKEMPVMNISAKGTVDERINQVTSALDSFSIVS